jgi:hypothetical protein
MKAGYRIETPAKFPIAITRAYHFVGLGLAQLRAGIGGHTPLLAQLRNASQHLEIRTPVHG